MRLRPAQARWFEVFVARDLTVRAVEALARTGVVQLEVDPRHADSADSAKLRHFVSRFEELAASAAGALPGGSERAATLVGDPVHIANQAVHRLRVWLARHDYLEEKLAQLQAEHEELLLLAECVEGLRGASLDLDGIFQHTRFLCKCLFACPHGLALEANPDNAIEAVVKGPQHDFLYVAASPEQQATIQNLVVRHGCAQFGIPHWLEGEHGLQQRRIVARFEQVAAEIHDYDAEARALLKDPEIGVARANIATLRWFLEHAPGMLERHALCHVTGWCANEDPGCLSRVLAEVGIEAVVRFPEPPARASPPVDLLDRWWTRPFRPFVGMWGVPDRAEIDPTGLLPIVVPLLFGYMFPDVGHGLILALGAALAARRWPGARFLVPCGVSAMFFGLVFGEAFGIEDLIEPLWVRPLDAPVAVLAVPMALGVLLILMGMLFAGIEARWRGELGAWLRVDAAVAYLYLGLLLAYFIPQAAWLAAPALVHYFLGSLSLDRAHPWRALGEALGTLLLSVFELAMNTLSFARVGAFALAHAALSHAILSLADMAPKPVPWVVALVVGTLFSIVLEGLLVYVQTTRLVLFEFFVQFLRTEGRLFRKTPSPAQAGRNVTPRRAE